MAEDFKNKIQRLELENFTCFAKAEMDFSSGINVFIGENGTGKTHVLKVLYGTIYDSNNYFIPSNNSIVTTKYNDSTNFSHLKLVDRISDYLISYFNPESKSLKSMIRKNQIGLDLKLKAVFNNESIELNISPTNKNEPIFKSVEEGSVEYNTSRNFETSTNSLFIPSNEMLSLYKGFISAYERRENSFDGTHYHLAKALDALPLRGQALEEAKPLLNDLNKEIHAQVFNKNGQFFLILEDENIEIEAPLAAEGLKKLAQIIYLIQNGSLTKDTILFWDEPEVNLNPKYIKIVAKFLQTLAKNGVQIFVATHDYLLAHLLSLDAEYSEETAAPPMKFFSFYKGEDGTEIEAADTIAGLQHNALLDEYAAYYDLEQALFRKSMQNV